jgi:hypothetical protein
MTGEKTGFGGMRAQLLAPEQVDRSRKPWVTGVVRVNGRVLPRISTRLSRRDAWGAVKVRWNIGRDAYAVLPGLYAVGAPSPDSPVLVSANYKLSFDMLRRSLADMDAWILVLDTKGINVWCAAGKGTFGTEELIRRIEAVRLGEIVSHRDLVLPQLGAPGVSKPQVKKAAGWTVIYGPVRAEDIPAWFAAGRRKTDEMRKVSFRLAERMAVAPVELVQAWPILLAAAAASLLLALPFTSGFGARLIGALVPLLGGALAAVFAFPALLPWLPFRAFALKGAVLGLAWGIASCLAAGAFAGATAARGAGLTLIVMPLSAFIAMNFTGSSTFTSQTGAALEVRRGLLPMAASLLLGVGLTTASRLLAL